MVAQEPIWFKRSPTTWTGSTLCVLIITAHGRLKLENTALYDANLAQTITTDYGIRQWLASGVPPVRAVLGLAMYGRTWYLKDASQNGVGAPAISAGPNSGVYTYDEINEFIRTRKAVCRADAVTKSAYCYGRTSDGTLWDGYDDKRTIVVKVHYLKAKQLKGYFF